MALPTFNTKSPTIKRILKEASELASLPDPTLHAAPLETNLFEWHFTLQGPPSTPYGAGIYHGRIILPPSYPLRPPSFRFLTPSGRFEVNREICLSISGHHEETWQPAWGIRTALWALRAFMEGDAKGQVGGMEMGEKERKRLAQESRSWACNGCGGRSNETILKEEEERSGESSTVDQVVPDELKFGFRDEMGKSPAGKSKDDGVTLDSRPKLPDEPPASTELCQIRNELPAESATSTDNHSPSPAVTQTSHTQQIPNNTMRNERPPAWIDKVITGVAAALAVMVIKKVAA